METNRVMAEKIFTAFSDMADFFPVDANIFICLKVTDLWLLLQVPVFM